MRHAHCAHDSQRRPMQWRHPLTQCTGTTRGSFQRTDMLERLRLPWSPSASSAASQRRVATYMVATAMGALRSSPVSNRLRKRPRLGVGEPDPSGGSRFLIPCARASISPGVAASECMGASGTTAFARSEFSAPVFTHSGRALSSGRSQLRTQHWCVAHRLNRAK